jgi:hypothetical protein
MGSASSSFTDKNNSINGRYIVSYLSKITEASKDVLDIAKTRIELEANRNTAGTVWSQAIADAITAGVVASITENEAGDI